MKLKLTLAAIASSVFLLTGCVAITSVSIDNPVAKSKGEKLTAESSAVGVLSLTVPNATRLEGEALERLNDQGATKNVTSRLQVRNWFGFVQVYKVVVTGEK